MSIAREACQHLFGIAALVEVGDHDGARLAGALDVVGAIGGLVDVGAAAELHEPPSLQRRSRRRRSTHHRAGLIVAEHDFMEAARGADADQRGAVASPAGYRCRA